MATFTITPASSVSTVVGAAFSDDTANADKLIVEADAFLISTAPFGALLANTGAWKATIYGSVFGNVDGVNLVSGNTEASTIIVGEEGQVGSGAAGSGIRAASAATIDNSGTISSGFYGLQFSAEGTVINSGTISGGSHSIVALSADDLAVANSGTLNGRLSFSGGNDTLANHKTGIINGNVSLGAGDDKIVNLGSINGNVLASTETTKLMNGGTISGSITGGVDEDTITNIVKSGKKAYGGTIEGNIDLRFGDDTFNNYKKFKIGDKKIKVSGEVEGTIDLGEGNDKFNGGDNAETVVDNDGADTVTLRAGDDTYIATGALSSGDIDVIDGGKGTDLYDASASAGNVLINLSASLQDDAGPPFAGITPLAANTAIGTSVALGASDTVKNFENAAGGSGSDVIFGSEGNNLLQGNAAGDDLYGLAGSDQLEGGAGDDNLVGGAGRDILIGGTEDDTFWFFDVSDSGTKAAKRDLIVDFEADGAAGEVIDLSRIDAIAGGADDAFTFIGTNVVFAGNAGELRAYWSANGQIVEGDVDGDAKADFSFELADADHSITLSANNNDDFVL